MYPLVLNLSLISKIDLKERMDTLEFVMRFHMQWILISRLFCPPKWCEFKTKLMKYLLCECSKIRFQNTFLQKRFSESRDLDAITKVEGQLDELKDIMVKNIGLLILL